MRALAWVEGASRLGWDTFPRTRVGQTDAAASAIGAFRLPPGHGERRGLHFERFLLAAALPEGPDGG